MSEKKMMRESPGHDPTTTFAADAMLGRLARKLRMLGYDVFYRAGIDDNKLKRIALRERRVLLTRDLEIGETSLPIHVVLIDSDDIGEQLIQVVSELGLAAGPSSFTRCTECNEPLVRVDKEAVRDLVPPYVYRTQDAFARCPSCGRIYWEATHVDQAREWLRDALDGWWLNGDPRGEAEEATSQGEAEEDPAESATNVFVTGRPGVGKTTLIRRVLSDIGADAGGFYTSEIRERGTRVGFSITSLDGESGTLARVDYGGPYRVGKYGVNREDLERVGVAALESATAAAELVIMDEIGRMELCSPAFQTAVMKALDGRTPVLGTIQDRSNRFLDAVRARKDVEVIEITEGNRDEMVAVVSDRVRELLEGE
jgi:nucleoside-triphosphatase